MFDNRHCVDEDLDLLVSRTNKIIFYIEKGDLSKLDEYLKFIERFDKDIADSINRDIKKGNNPIRVIKDNIEVLKQNVIVDINEHR